MLNLIGRNRELSKLKQIVSRKEASFLGLYGRRRVGKTYLIEQFAAHTQCKIIQVTGLKDADMKTQLSMVNKAISKALGIKIELAALTRWDEALEKLSEVIEQYLETQHIILFFDELPWLATPRSKLVQTIDHYWNTRWRLYKQFTFVACGSAASWMLDNLIHNKGGLHNRLSDSMRLEPFTLKETKAYLASRSYQKDNDKILQIYLATGGIAHYLKQIQANLSVMQNINRLCFHPDGLLFNEFDDLYSSLFDSSEFHIELIKIIASKKNGISRDDIIKNAKLSGDGGELTKRLNELEEASFITGFIPYGKIKRGKYFRMLDEYSLFYLTWIEPAKESLKRLTQNHAYWENMANTQAYKIWSGLAFEAICFKHIHEITRALQIEHLVMGISGWRNADAQIDLLIDRHDNAINICEIKLYNQPLIIDKQYASKLQKKVEHFKKSTATKKECILTLITVNGVKLNMYSQELVHAEVQLNDLFL